MLENKFACLISTFSSLHLELPDIHMQNGQLQKISTQFALVHHQLALSVQVPSQAVVLI